MAVGDLIVTISSFFRVAMPAKAESATRCIDVFFGSSTTGPKRRDKPEQRLIGLPKRRGPILKVLFD